MISKNMISSKPGQWCPDCGRGKLVFPNAWWKHELEMLRCVHCHRTAKALPEDAPVDMLLPKGFEKEWNPEEENGK